MGEGRGEKGRERDIGGKKKTHRNAWNRTTGVITNSPSSTGGDPGSKNDKTVPCVRRVSLWLLFVDIPYSRDSGAVSLSPETDLIFSLFFSPFLSFSLSLFFSLFLLSYLPPLSPHLPPLFFRFSFEGRKGDRERNWKNIIRTPWMKPVTRG